MAGIAAMAVAADVRADQTAPTAVPEASEFHGEPRVPVTAVALTVGAWLAAEFDLPAAPPPAIRFSSPEAMSRLYRGGGAAPTGSAGARAVAALYDRRRATIHLPEGWTGADPVELSMLVHEMVHYLQARAGWRPGCAAEAEALAYRAQARWLALFGQDLTRVLAVDPIFLRLLGVCGF